jgi:hypothetical protein
VLARDAREGSIAHDRYPDAGKGPDALADEPTTVEIEPNHFVGCFELESEKGRQIA